VGLTGRLFGWRRSLVALQRLALASIVVNIAIVVTGGAVRLTNSGLGCPTWPKCDGTSLIPTPQNAIHGLIEFGNRTFTFVLVLVAAATLVAAWSQLRSVELALAAFLMIPAQAVIGGVSVLTDLNPWVVSAHLLLSMANIAITLCLWHAVADQAGRPAAPPALRSLAWATATMAAAVLMLGTLVTGSGPHAGDLRHGRVHRTGLDPAGMAHLHADAVMVLIGLTAGLVFATYLGDDTARLRRPALTLFGLELAQGLVGFVQYFTHLPIGLVALHMLGACLVWLAAVEVVIQATERQLQQPAHRIDQHANQRADHRAVHPDELQVPADL
jgi:cytochrome c oxidase assembly protein subunit 15